MLVDSSASTLTNSLSPDILNFGNINSILESTVSSSSWLSTQEKFNQVNNIVILGHGGNLAVADHIGVDIARLTKYSKQTFVPGSAIVCTSFINDTSFDDWMKNWFASLNSILKPENTLVIGISSSGRSKDIARAFDYCLEQGYVTSLITAKKSTLIKSTYEVVTNCSSYHTSEIVALALGYQLVHATGFNCPEIK